MLKWSFLYLAEWHQIMSCSFIAYVWNVIRCSNNLKYHWSILNNHFTIGRKQNEENHWFFDSSYQKFLEVIMGNKLFLGIEVFYFKLFNYSTSSCIRAILRYNLLTKHQSRYCIFFIVKSIMELYTILLLHG